MIIASIECMLYNHGLINRDGQDTPYVIHSRYFFLKLSNPHHYAYFYSLCLQVSHRYNDFLGLHQILQVCIIILSVDSWVRQPLEWVPSPPEKGRQYKVIIAEFIIRVGWWREIPGSPHPLYKTHHHNIFNGSVPIYYYDVLNVGA